MTQVCFTSHTRGADLGARPALAAPMELNRIKAVTQFERDKIRSKKHKVGQRWPNKCIPRDIKCQRVKFLPSCVVFLVDLGANTALGNHGFTTGVGILPMSTTGGASLVRLGMGTF